MKKLRMAIVITLFIGMFSANGYALNDMRPLQAVYLNLPV